MSDEATPYEIPEGERYFLDANGYCWRSFEGEPNISMARVNPDNSPTPRPWLYLQPVPVSDEATPNADSGANQVSAPKVGITHPISNAEIAELQRAANAGAGWQESSDRWRNIAEAADAENAELRATAEQYRALRSWADGIETDLEWLGTESAALRTRVAEAKADANNYQILWEMALDARDAAEVRLAVLEATLEDLGGLVFADCKVGHRIAVDDEGTVYACPACRLAVLEAERAKVQGQIERVRALFPPERDVYSDPDDPDPVSTYWMNYRAREAVARALLTPGGTR